jgi:hypothetical protein
MTITYGGGLVEYAFYYLNSYEIFDDAKICLENILLESLLITAIFKTVYGFNINPY